MLEAFHSYATELYLIGKQQVPGSRLQRAVYSMAKWLFVKGRRRQADHAALNLRPEDSGDSRLATEELAQLY
jgi:hypothetical protein